MADQTVEEAKVKAKSMVAEAEARAKNMTEQAQMRPREVTEAAQMRAREVTEAAQMRAREVTEAAQARPASSLRAWRPATRSGSSRPRPAPAWPRSRPACRSPRRPSSGPAPPGAGEPDRGPAGVRARLPRPAPRLRRGPAQALEDAAPSARGPAAAPGLGGNSRPLPGAEDPPAPSTGARQSSYSPCATPARTSSVTTAATGSTGCVTTTDCPNVKSGSQRTRVVAGALLALALSLGLLVASLFRADGLGLVWARWPSTWSP